MIFETLKKKIWNGWIFFNRDGFSLKVVMSVRLSGPLQSFEMQCQWKFLGKDHFSKIEN